jgi:hypothetical protein
MSPAQFVTNIEFLASVALLIWFFYGPWQNIVLDATRQILFEARDEVFLAAADGKLKFDSAEYVLFRQRFNSAIRVAHEVTWIQVLAFALSPNKGQDVTPGLYDAIAKMENRDMAARMHQLIQRASYAMFGAIILRSPVLLVLNILALPLAALLLLTDYAGVRNRLWLPLKRLVEKDVKCLAAAG